MTAVRRCGYHAIVAETDKLEETEQFKYNIALPPPSLYAQFPPETSAAAIWEGLHRLGFDEIFDVAVASEYISLEIAAYLKNYNGGRKPLSGGFKADSGQISGTHQTGSACTSSNRSCGYLCKK